MNSRDGYWPILHHDVNFEYEFVEAFGINEELASQEREGTTRLSDNDSHV